MLTISGCILAGDPEGGLGSPILQLRFAPSPLYSVSQASWLDLQNQHLIHLLGCGPGPALITTPFKGRGSLLLLQFPIWPPGGVDNTQVCSRPSSAQSLPVAVVSFRIKAQVLTMVHQALHDLVTMWPPYYPPLHSLASGHTSFPLITQPCWIFAPAVPFVVHTVPHAFTSFRSQTSLLQRGPPTRTL